MSTGTVLDTMVVQLVSDISGYVANMQQAAQVATATAQNVMAAVANIAGAQNQQKAAAAQLKTQMQAAAQVTQSTLTPLERYRQSMTNLNQLHRQGLITTQTYTRAVANLGKEYRQATSRVDEYVAKTMMVGMQLQSIGRGIQSFGRMLTTSITLPLMAFGALSFKAFLDFDHAMTNSLSIMKATEEQARRMKAQALDMGSKLPQGPIKLAEAYYFLVSAGLNVEQTIAAIPVVAAFATAGAFDLAAATNYLADAQSALGLKVADATQNMLNMTRVSDVLALAANVSNASIEQFSVSLTSKAGASIKVFNKQVEEGVAVLAVYADQGVKAELAGNALDRVLRLLNNSAMDEAENQKKLGFAVYDNTGKMRNMADIVENLEMVLAGMSDQQKAVTLDMLGFDARMQQIILPLIGTSQAIRNYEEQLKNAGGTTQEVADKQLKSFWNQILITWNSLKVIGIELVEKLAPAMEWINKTIQDATAGWRKMDSATQAAILVMIAMAAAAGPLIMAIGAVIAAIGGLITALVALYVAGGPVTLAVALITIAIIGLIAQVALVTTAFAGLMVWLFGWDNVSAAIKGAADAVVNFAKSSIGWLANFKTNMNLLGGWIVKNWWKISIDVANFWTNAMRNMSENAWIAFKKAVGMGGDFKSLTAGFTSVLDPMPEFSYEIGKDVVQKLEDGVKEATGEAAPAAEDYANKMKEALNSLDSRTDVLDNVKSKIKDVTATMQEQIDTFGMSQRQVTMFKLQKDMIADLDDMKKKGVSQAVIDARSQQYTNDLLQLEAMDDKLTALEEEKKAMDDAARSADKLANATANLTAVEADSSAGLALVEEYRKRFENNVTTGGYKPVMGGMGSTTAGGQVTPNGPSAATANLQSGNSSDANSLLAVIASNTARPPIILQEANLGGNA